MPDTKLILIVEETAQRTGRFHAALDGRRLTVEDPDRGAPRFRPWKPREIWEGWAQTATDDREAAQEPEPLPAAGELAIQAVRPDG